MFVIEYLFLFLNYKLIKKKIKKIILFKLQNKINNLI